jgi:hypothetical protein
LGFVSTVSVLTGTTTLALGASAIEGAIMRYKVCIVVAGSQ